MKFKASFAQFVLGTFLIFFHVNSSAQSCVGEGRSRGVYPNAPQCCPGLVEVAPPKNAPDGQGPTCIKKSGSAQSCVGEGGSIPLIPNRPSCCPGLVLEANSDDRVMGSGGICKTKSGMCYFSKLNRLVAPSTTSSCAPKNICFGEIVCTHPEGKISTSFEVRSFVNGKPQVQEFSHITKSTVACSEESCGDPVKCLFEEASVTGYNGMDTLETNIPAKVENDLNRQNEASSGSRQ